MPRKSTNKPNRGSAVSRKNAADWTRSGGGYDQFTKNDPAREKAAGQRPSPKRKGTRD